ncbi:MAG: ADP-ribose pyrophosphatase, partial [Clostridia bacterium]
MTAKSIVDFGTIYPTPAYTNEPLSIFLATELTKGDNNLDDGEFLNVVTMPFEQALAMVMSNEIFDAKTVVAIVAILKYAKLRKVK